MFVIPVAMLALLCAGVLGLVLLWFVAAAVWNPLLHRLGLRTISRQRVRATLIVCGLALSSTVAGSALGAGDTIANTLQSLIAGSLGTVDEVIVLNPPRARLFQQAQALVEPGFGGLAAARLQFFAESEFETARQAARSTTAIAAIAPSIVEQVTVVGGRQLRSAVPLLALPADYGAAFGALVQHDGTSVSLASLHDDQLVLNQAAADIWGSTAGQTLQLLRGDATITMRIAAVVTNGGLGGASPLLVVPLEPYQRLANRVGEINQIIVANAGATQSVRRSDEASRVLRLALTDLDIARELHTLIGRADVQQGLLDLEADLDGRARTNVRALRMEGARAPMSDEFVRLIAAPQVRQRLFGLAWRAGDNGREASSLLRRLTELNVLDVKQEALGRAQRFGSVVTTIFLVLGVFSLAAAVLLVFLIFHLLAADRGVELATLRALGMRRSQIMTLFLVEGLVYNLVGAAIGIGVSIGAVIVLAGSIGDVLRPWGVTLAHHTQPASLILAFAASALVTFVAMLLAAYRVAHGAIVGGTRGETGTERPVRQGFGVGAVLVVVAALIWWRWNVPAVAYVGRHPLVTPVTFSLAAWGVGSCSSAMLRALIPRHVASAGSAVASVGALVIGAAWIRVLGRTYSAAGLETNILTVTIGAIVLLVVAVLLVAQLLGPALGLLDRVLVWLPRLRAAARPAISYLQIRRGRAGMTIAMFAMVVCIMVAALTLIEALLTAYGSDEPPVGGYHLRADVANGATFDLDRAFANASATAPDAFDAYGGLASLDTEVVEFGLSTAAWRNAHAVIADDGFLAGIRTGVERTTDAVDRSGASWAELGSQPGAAIVVGAVLDTGGGTSAATGRTVWMRGSAGGTPVKLQIIGVADTRSSLEPGVYIGRSTAARLGTPLPAPTTYYFAVRPGTRTVDAVQGLRISFGEQGLTISELDAAAEIARSVRLVLTAIVQGFMGIGLIAGVAALGLLGIQSVLERRQQLGMLRALGFRRRDVRATLAWEGSTVGLLGIGLGTVLGLVLARSVISIIATANPEVRFDVPWNAIVQTMALAVGGAALAIAVAAWQAGRISPAEALRLD